MGNCVESPREPLGGLDPLVPSRRKLDSMRMNEAAQTISQKSRSESGIFRQIGYDEGLAKRQSAWAQSLEEDLGMSEMTPVPAATVVVARDSEAADSIEILLLRRNSKLVFHGDTGSFPEVGLIRRTLRALTDWSIGRR